MARIKVMGPIGELSGKLGGQVFARNKTGPYVRANAIGTNPNTDAQIRARTAFGTSSSQYHTLTSLEKVGWQNFASNSFVPKGGTVPGTLSGFNAFVSMRSVIENAQQMNVPTTTINVNSVATTVTSTPFSYATTAPSNMALAGLTDDTGNQFGLTMRPVAVLSQVGLLSDITIELNAAGVALPPTITEFRSSIITGQTPTGFALYASKGQAQANMFTENEEEYLFGYIKPLVFATPKVFTDVELIFSLPQSPTKYQQLPQIGQFTRLSLYTVSENGMMNKVAGIIAEIN